LKWSVERAGIEFGCTSNTLRKALNKNSAQPDTDGCFSTRQITDAVFGGLNEERLATQRQLTKEYSLENAITEASVLNKAALEAGFSQLADALVHVITSSTQMTHTEKEDFLRNLSSWPIILKNVARNQPRLVRSNGQTSEEDESES
jgi:hypothetical protein